MTKTKLFLLSLVLILSYNTMTAQNKSSYDLGQNIPAGKFAGKVYGAGSLFVKSDKLEYSLLSGGYYTIGTSLGQSSSASDNNCQVLFGHPYALTSYPLFYADGRWQKGSDYFDASEQSIKKHGDTLSSYFIRPGKLAAGIDIFKGVNGSRVCIEVTLKNLDTQPSELAAGTLFDPALGKWGDGSLLVNGVRQENEIVYSGSSLPSALEVWERNGMQKGMGIAVSCENAGEIKASNWFKMAGIEPFGTNTTAIYDLAIRALSDIKVFQPGEEVKVKVMIDLLEPDFSGKAIVRWDVPSSFSIENSVLFPLTITTSAEITNNTQTQINDLKLTYQENEAFQISLKDTAFSISGEGQAFQKIKMESFEIYEPYIAKVKLTVKSSGSTIDELIRTILIPQSPYSDTGLTVRIDTVFKGDSQQMSAVFSVKKSATGQIIGALRKQNVLLSENDTRIPDFTLGYDTTGGAGKSDIIFVLDVTGSMSEEINGVKNNIKEFADSLKFSGCDFRLGMVTFLDNIENKYQPTADVNLFSQNLAAQYAHEGGDGPENSLFALITASELNFRPDAQKIFIWITDAPYHEQDDVTALSRQQVINVMLSKGIKVFAIGPTDNQTTWYDPIIDPTGGTFYDIYGNFRDILLSISRLQKSNKLMISYQSNSAAGSSSQLKITVHYGGCGGSATYGYSMLKPSAAEKIIMNCYPNPFNPETIISVSKPYGYTGSVIIYNLLGQKVRSFELNPEQQLTSIKWNGVDNFGRLISSGTYIVQTIIYDLKRRTADSASQKIMFLK